MTSDGLPMASLWPPGGLPMASRWPPDGLPMASDGLLMAASPSSRWRACHRPEHRGGPTDAAVWARATHSRRYKLRGDPMPARLIQDWVLEMWGYAIAAASQGVRHKIIEGFQIEPNAYARTSEDFNKRYYIFHYTCASPL